MNVQLFILGGGVLTLICVVFQGIWSKKIKSSEQLSDYLQKRMQTATQTYQVVLLAYELLEHNFIIKPVTIRTTLLELQDMLAKNPKKSEVLNRFLNLLSQQCSVEVAAIFPVQQGLITKEPLASVGQVKQPNAADFLVQECFDNVAMAYVSPQDILNKHVSDYIVTVPFLDQSNRIYAMLLIEEMPFLSLNDDNLAIMNLLIQYFNDGNSVKAHIRQ